MEKKEIILQLQAAHEIIERCIVALGSGTATTATRKPSKPATPQITKVNFALNPRNFVKTYGRGMNGQEKFVLLLAFLTKGKTGVDIEISALVALWGKMTAKELLGYTYNNKYPTAAKTSGWIDSKKHATYHLRSSWKEIFS